MVLLKVSPEEQNALISFVASTKHPSLVTTYLFFIERKYNLQPVLFARDKIIFQSKESAVEILESESKLSRETELFIGRERADVNEETKKIYICPFTGKVFGDNTHPNPQDAIYEWVANCKENTEWAGGTKTKRFFISEDPTMIQSYAAKFKPKAPMKKIVFSSAINGKLFHSKEAVIEDFKSNYLKPMSLVEVQNQNRYQIEPSFLTFIKTQLADEKIASFVELCASIEALGSHVERWLQEAS
jgi:hypothetical protein